MVRKTQNPDDAVSITVGFILNIAVATLTLSLLLLSLQGTLTNVTESAERTQLRLVGEQVASELMQADRLSTIARNMSGSVTLRIPDEITGDSYIVEVTQGWVNVTSGTVTARVMYNVTTDVHGAEFRSGGERKIFYNSTDIVIR